MSKKYSKYFHKRFNKDKARELRVQHWHKWYQEFLKLLERN